MTTHVAPTTKCNLGCTYCYENPARDIGMAKNEYDMDAIMDRIRDWVDEYPNEAPGFHGGEPLLIDIDDMERLFKFVDTHYDDQTSSVQSNGVLIRDEHIRIFAKYNVSIGISIDGPPELNKERVAKNGETDNATVTTLRNIVKMRSRGVSVGLITVLSKRNAGTDEKLERLLSWIDNMNRMGVTGHFNPAIPYEDVQEDISLSPERLKEVYLRTWEWMRDAEHRSWNPMQQYIDNLLGNPVGNCVNNTCDVYNANAAKIVNGDGETTGCGKTWDTVGDGVPFLQGPSSGNEYEETQERYDMLKQTPGPHTEGQEDEGGCKGCKYWAVCQGGCPASGQNDDHRNRTIWCEAKYAMYERVEQDLRSLLPNIELITDIPWYVEHNKKNNDLRPFRYIDPATPERSSASGFAKSNAAPLSDRVEMDWDESVRFAKDKYPEDSLTIDYQNKNIHADSGWQKE